MTVGIEALGIEIPVRRLSGELLRGAWGGAAKGARSVASHDQDPVTLVVDAIHGSPALLDGPVAGLYLASTTFPLEDGGNANQVAVGADLSESVFTGELAGSVGAGAHALRAAEHAVRAGAGRVVVAAAEVQSPEPGSAAEAQCGDGAVVVALGPKPHLAEVLGHATLTTGTRERWRARGAAFTEEADRPFVQEKGFPAALRSLASRVLAQHALDASSIHVALAVPDAATDKGLRASLGFPADRMVPDTSLDTIGGLGAAGFLWALARGLAAAKPGEHLLVMGAATGAEAVLLRAGEGAPSVAPLLERALATSRPIARYPQYLRMRELLPGERIAPWTSPAVLARDERALVRWRGSRCTSCGAIELPPKPVCHACDGRSFTEAPLGRAGTLVTFTADHLVPSPEPPTIMAAADLEGGGRYYAEVVDVAARDMKIGQRVGLTFRRIHMGGGFPNYGWKMRPLL